MIPRCSTSPTNGSGTKPRFISFFHAIPGIQILAEWQFWTGREANPVATLVNAIVLMLAIGILCLSCKVSEAVAGGEGVWVLGA
jgi:hypothetical protein